jgi:hypothetical protein
MGILVLPILFKIRPCVEEEASRRLSRAGYGFKKLHNKDGLILSQPKAVSLENRGIGLIFLP